MKCQGKFKFIELKRKDGGVFTNSQGKQIPYKESYALKLNEITDNGIYERVFKLPIDSALVPILAQIKPYEDITLNFDIVIYGTTVKVNPISLVK